MLSSFEKEFSLQTMDGALLNVSEESDSIRLSPAVLGNLKALSSGSLIQVQRKQGHPYSMKPTAKLAFAANKPPSLSGTEDALKSRMIVVPFDLNLEDHGTTETTSRIDWKLKEKLQSELPGILNVVLRSLEDFLKRTPRKIYRAAASHHAMNLIMRDSDPIEEWLQDSTQLVKLSVAQWVSIDDLFLNFKDEPREEYMNEKWFAKKLRQKLGTKIEIERKQHNGRRGWFIRGVVLRSDAKRVDEF